MSFDVFLQRFTDGGAGVGGNSQALRILEPYVVRDEDGKVSGLHTRNGSADVFGLDDGNGFMVNHVEGRMLWDVLVEVAQSAGFAIMPIGCPVCVPNQDMIKDLPVELIAAQGSRVVLTGSDLLEAIQGPPDRRS